MLRLFMLNGKRASLLLGFMACALLGLGSLQAQVPLDCSKLLGSSQSSDLFNVDLASGAGFPIGFMPPGLATEIEYDTVTGTLYAEETNGGLLLYTIDPLTGAPLGAVAHVYGALNGMEYVGTTLFATFIPCGGCPSDLVVVDTTTGNLGLVGPTGFGPISGLAYDILTGTMYGVTAGGGPATLVTIDLLTGAATPIAPVLLPTGQPLNRIGSIEFGPDGQLYGGLTWLAMAIPNHLVTIDTSTGLATVIGDTGFSVTGLTSCFGQLQIDIKFCSNPNAFNCKKKGVLPVTIFGTATFDVTMIDPASLQLCLADMSACTAMPVRNYGYEDLGDPAVDLGAAMCAMIDTDGDGIPDTELDTRTPDGIMDMNVSFEATDVQSLLAGFCGSAKGTVSAPLIVKGVTFDGIPVFSAPVPDVGIDQLLKVNK